MGSKRNPATFVTGLLCRTDREASFALSSYGATCTLTRKLQS